MAADRNKRITSFNCQADVSAQRDGKWYFCAEAADAAVPDNPDSHDQFANATSNNANLSGVACGYVTLDRQPPAVTVAASATTVTVGQLVSFGASATDPSGVSGKFDWEFGDNTQHGVRSFRHPHLHAARDLHGHGCHERRCRQPRHRHSHRHGQTGLQRRLGRHQQHHRRRADKQTD